MTEIKKAASNGINTGESKARMPLQDANLKENFSTSTKCIVSEKTEKLTDQGIVAKHKNELLNMA